MVPDREPPTPSRAFSPEIEEALERALQEPWQNGSPPESLRRSLESAASEARERRLQPEEMLVAFKALERRIQLRMTGNAQLGSDDRARVVRALIEAYFSE